MAIEGLIYDEIAEGISDGRLHVDLDLKIDSDKPISIDMSKADILIGFPSPPSPNIEKMGIRQTYVWVAKCASTARYLIAVRASKKGRISTKWTELAVKRLMKTDDSEISKCVTYQQLHDPAFVPYKPGEIRDRNE